MREAKSAVAPPDRWAAPKLLSATEMLGSVISFVRTQLWLVLATMSAFTLLGVTYLLNVAPSFTATATILVDSRGFAQLYQHQLNTIDTAAAQNQIAIIKSEDVARRVVTELDLANDPEFAGKGALAQLVIFSNSLFGRRSLDADLEPYPRAIRSLARQLTAKAVPASRVVDISFRSGNPKRAAQIANAVAEATIASQLEARSQAALAAGQWLDERLAELRREAEATDRELAAFNGRSDVGAQPELLKLESSARAFRGEYDNLLRRSLEWTQQRFPFAEARIISKASPEFEQASPDTPVVLALATVTGLVAGCALALLRRMTDRTLRSGLEVEAALHADCIRLIPQIGLRKPNLCIGLIPQIGLGKSNLTPPITFNAGLSDLTRASKVIGLASALPGEGRTTVALALAHLLARNGQRTILVDCDLSNCQLSRALCPDRGGGVLDILAHGGALEAAVWTDPETGLTVLPAGSGASVRADMELTLPSVRSLFDRLRVEYDAVVLDLPPLAAMCQAGVGPDLVDGYVFVIEWGRTDARVVEVALAEARGVHESLLGVVVNKVNLRRPGRQDPGFAQNRRRSSFVRRQGTA
jgi:Mrp family chromosome partitioning ATPase